MTQEQLVNAAYDAAPARERVRPGDPPLLASARRLHYCVRASLREDAIGHAIDMLRRLFEDGGFSLAGDNAYSPTLPLIVRVGHLVEAVERIGTDVEPYTSLAYVRLLAVVNGLVQTEVAVRVALQRSIEAGIQLATDKGDPAVAPYG